MNIAYHKAKSPVPYSLSLSGETLAYSLSLHVKDEDWDSRVRAEIAMPRSHVDWRGKTDYVFAS